MIHDSTTHNLQSVPFTLESGAQLPEITFAYRTYGTPNEDRSNAVLVLHALTGWPAAHEWWEEILGSNKLLDPSKHYIISPNLLGSCYGTTGPESIDPRRATPYYASFPTVTIRDIARSVWCLLDEIGIDDIPLAIGGSMGGMVLLEMAALQPDRFRAIIPIAVSGLHSAWRIAFSSTIRKAVIAHDPSLSDRKKLQDGLRLARQFAMTSYRSAEEFDLRFGRERVRTKFEVENYLEHQGEKIVERFSPYSYLTLTRAMELYDLAEGPGTMEDVAATITCPAHFVGISSDVLYAPSEIEQFAALFPNAQYSTLHALHGHDSFLVDGDELATILRPFVTSTVTDHQFCTAQ